MAYAWSWIHRLRSWTALANGEKSRVITAHSVGGVMTPALSCSHTDKLGNVSLFNRMGTNIYFLLFLLAPSSPGE